MNDAQSDRALCAGRGLVEVEQPLSSLQQLRGLHFQCIGDLTIAGEGVH